MSGVGCKEAEKEEEEETRIEEKFMEIRSKRK